MSFVGDLERLFASSLYPLRIPLFVAGIVVAALLVRTARRRGWLVAVRSHLGRSALVLALILAVALPLGWYLASPLFITTRIDEAPPIAAGTLGPGVAGASPSIVLSPPSPPSAVAASPALAERRGTFHGEDDFHFGRGTARLFGTPDGVVLRFEGFEVRNGPDL